MAWITPKAAPLTPMQEYQASERAAKQAARLLKMGYRLDPLKERIEMPRKTQST